MNTKDLTLAYKIRHALDENVTELPMATQERLATARALALTRKKQQATVAVTAPAMASAGHAGSTANNRLAWLGRMGYVIPLAALVFGLMGIHQYEKHQQIIEAASIDAEVLTDELPLSAYVDHGFDAYLAKEEN